MIGTPLKQWIDAVEVRHLRKDRVAAIRERLGSLDTGSLELLSGRHDCGFDFMDFFVA